MYTIDDQKEDLYEDEYYENNTWNNRKGLIFKIIIIILCIIVLIWLIKALKSNRSMADNGEIHAANVEKIRLAAEDYFFLKNNKEKSSYISLGGLKSEGLINDIVDANNEVCSDSNSGVKLNKESGVYEMRVNLSCSTNEKEEIFYYNYNTLACLNCNGKTNMLGNTVVAKAEEDKKEEINYVSDDISNNYDEYKYYSCTNWTNWSKTRLYESYLTERTKTLVQGVKYDTKTVYGEWSDYTTTPITANDNLEVDTQTLSETVWGETKTGTDINPNNKNIKIISQEEITETNDECKNGYIEDGVCYSNEVYNGNLTYEEYNSGKYKVQIPVCEGVKILRDQEGLNVLTYINCNYNKILNTEVTSNTYTLYTYQEKTTSNVVNYRSRSITTVTEPIYTLDKYEEQELPSGYTKVDGTEETYYSYKLKECLK